MILNSKKESYVLHFVLNVYGHWSIEGFTLSNNFLTNKEDGGYMYMYVLVFSRKRILSLKVYVYMRTSNKMCHIVNFEFAGWQ